MPRAREVGNLILRDSGGAELLAGLGIHVCDGWLVRHHADTVTRASGDDLASQPGIFIHIQHVDAQMRHAGGDSLRQRISPALPGLVRKTGDQVDVDVVDAGGTKPFDFIERDGASMGASHRGCFMIHKRLHAQADAVESQARHGPQQFVTQLAGGTFQRHFRGGVDGKYFAYCFNYAA